eukprot:7903627-Pyramimonas_sp.AAC.1
MGPLYLPTLIHGAFGNLDGAKKRYLSQQKGLRQVSSGTAVLEQGGEGNADIAVPNEDHQAAEALVMLPPSERVQEQCAPHRVQEEPALHDDPEACREFERLLAKNACSAIRRA